MKTIDRILAMRDTDMVPREMVADVCGACAEKMANQKIRAIQAGVIKEALTESELKSAVKSRKE